jgi:hypothetical protein
MPQLFKEPFFHFVLIGAALFLLYSSVSDDGPGEDTIVVTQGQIATIATIFEKTWQRPPTQKELEGLVNDFIKEEVFYREALGMGLDQDDIIIRRRMRQKMEFVAEDMSSMIEPSETQLNEYLENNVQDFMIPPVFSFRQVYINPDEHSASLEQYMATVQGQLNEGSVSDPSTLSDRLMLDHEFRNVTPFEVSRTFGNDFADRLVTLERNTWVGPIRSGYGFHLVYVDMLQEGREPELEEVLSEVEREYMNAQRLEMLDLFYKRLAEKYEVIIEEGATEVGETNTPVQ